MLFPILQDSKSTLPPTTSFCQSYFSQWMPTLSSPLSSYNTKKPNQPLLRRFHHILLVNPWQSPSNGRRWSYVSSAYRLPSAGFLSLCRLKCTCLGIAKRHSYAPPSVITQMPSFIPTIIILPPTTSSQPLIDGNSDTFFNSTYHAS